MSKTGSINSASKELNAKSSKIKDMHPSFSLKSKVTSHKLYSSTVTTISNHLSQDGWKD